MSCPFVKHRSVILLVLLYALGLQAPVIESMERVSIQNDISEVTRELVKLEKDIVFLENQVTYY